MKPEDFKSKMIPFVNDVTVGWDLSEISRDEVSELISSVIHRLVQNDTSVPDHIWNSWIYVFGFENDRKRFKSLKDFGDLQSKNRMESVQKFLLESENLVQNLLEKEQVEQLYCFLLDSTKNSADVFVLLNYYLHIPKRLRGIRAWTKFLTKLVYYKDSPMDAILTLVHKMIVDDKLIPNKQFETIFGKYVQQYSSKSLSPSASDILFKLTERNLMYNAILCKFH
jgi:ribosomal protein L16 Arg81 hydroxylase